MDFGKSLDISAAGMRAQGTRLRIIAENIANADSTATTPGGQPYRRKLVTFANELDRASETHKVTVHKIQFDESSFSRRFEPGHPAADAEGYVLYPNVNSLIEMADMREAQRSYEANLRAIQAARTMLQQTIDILR